MMSKLIYAMSTQKTRESCIKLVNKSTNKMNCSDYVREYYQFIEKNPTKFTSDFIKHIGNCNILNCELPSER